MNAEISVTGFCERGFCLSTDYLKWQLSPKVMIFFFYCFLSPRISLSPHPQMHTERGEGCSAVQGHACGSPSLPDSPLHRSALSSVSVWWWGASNRAKPDSFISDGRSWQPCTFRHFVLCKSKSTITSEIMEVFSVWSWVTAVLTVPIKETEMICMLWTAQKQILEFWRAKMSILLMLFLLEYFGTVYPDSAAILCITVWSAGSNI